MTEAKWRKRGDFTWERNGDVVQWNGMPSSYSAWHAGEYLGSFETPEEAMRHLETICKVWKGVTF